MLRVVPVVILQVRVFLTHFSSPSSPSPLPSTRFYPIMLSMVVRKTSLMALAERSPPTRSHTEENATTPRVRIVAARSSGKSDQSLKTVWRISRHIGADCPPSSSSIRCIPLLGSNFEITASRRVTMRHGVTMRHRRVQRKHVFYNVFA